MPAPTFTVSDKTLLKRSESYIEAKLVVGNTYLGSNEPQVPTEGQLWPRGNN